MHTSGLIIGHFEPLHLGHMRSILHASGLVDTLHVVITKHPNPNPKFPVTLQDKARWLQMACRDLPFIRIHICDDLIFPVYDHLHQGLKNSDNNEDKGEPDDLNDLITRLAGYHAKVSYLIKQFDMAEDTVLFVSEGHSLTLPAVQSALSQLSPKLNILTTPYHAKFDSASIHHDPIKHWHIVHPEARSSYTKTVAIVGGESSGKTTLVHKLVNYYGASFALEMGRLYVGTDLGGTEVGLQYSDYAPIALDHAHAVRTAMDKASAPVTIVDTDFVTTQAFCEEYEGRTHPFVTACIEEFKFDHTIFLANNTPWVDDGMRSLGSQTARERFENRLDEIFARHNITPHRIISPDYQQRFEQAVAFIDKVVYGKGE